MILHLFVYNPLSFLANLGTKRNDKASYKGSVQLAIQVLLQYDHIKGIILSQK